jgi:RNA polymerase sigma-70 factor (ECF subfamily)
MIRDSEIIRRIRQGDTREFESLFRSSYVSLVRYARTLVRDYDTAEEIVQDLFFKLWKDKDRLYIESSLNGYLYRAVHNSCLHYLSHNRVVEKYAREMKEKHHISTENPTEMIHYRELQARIARILERLPEKCGKIFCMNRFEGLKYAEIAEKLSVSVKTVEANMGRALKEFRKALAEQ